MTLPKKGDIIRFPRGAHHHYGIYIGGGKVIHRATPPVGPSSTSATSSSVSGAKSDKAVIRVDNLQDIVGDREKAEIVNFLDDKYTPLPPNVIVERAKSKLGEQGYNVLFKNCEHFVTWCRYDEAVSQQVNLAKRIVAFGSPPTFCIISLVEAIRNATNPDFQ